MNVAVIQRALIARGYGLGPTGADGDARPKMIAAVTAFRRGAERFAADMQVSGATVFERAHPSTLALAHALGWSDAQMDDLWRSAAGL